MNTYRVYFDDYTTKGYIETGEPNCVQEYQARNRADALRQWMHHYYGYTADRIERITKVVQGENSAAK